jgi:DUF917 family protein
VNEPRELTPQEVDDTLVGATIFGCGGGGELEEGRALVAQAAASGRSPALVAPSCLDPDDIIAWCYAVGGLTPGLGDPRDRLLPRTEEHPTVLAVRALEAHIGRRVAAIVPGELGGQSVAEAFYPGAMLDVPVLDGESVGRAVPELQHSVAYLRGLPIAPQAIVNEFGDTVLITRVASDLRSEALVRALAVASRNAVWVADHALACREAVEGILPGSVSRALAVGGACRRAREQGADVAAAAAQAAGGRVVFRGVVTSCTWREHGGFTVGETYLRGHQAADESSYRVWFKNENLLAWRDDRPDVTCPDLICMISHDEGVPLTNPHATPGQNVDIVAVPAPAEWRTPRGVEVLGPRAFGFDVDFVPLDG